MVKNNKDFFAQLIRKDFMVWECPIKWLLDISLVPAWCGFLGVLCGHLAHEISFLK